MKIDLSGRTAVVTGGTAGIGLAAVRLFLEAGAAVALCGRDKDKSAGVADVLRADFPGANILAEACDVLDKSNAEAFAAAVKKTFGGTDMLVLNAGQARLSTFDNTSDAAWREELELKYFSVLNPAHAFLPQLETSDAAAIVCSSSLLGRQPEPHLVATSSARAGQLSLVHGMAHELAPKGIRVNSILIGQVASTQWRRRFEALEDKSVTWEAYTKAIADRAGVPLGRIGTPEEAASALFFLATPMSSFTTGSTVDVSGGLSRHVG